MKKILTFLLILVGTTAYAQSGEITGNVKDDMGGLYLANIVVIDATGKPTGRSTQADMDGNYSLKPLNPGRYDIQFSYTGMKTQVIKGVLVSADKATFLNVTLTTGSKELQEVEVVAYKVPLIDKGNTSQVANISKEVLKEQGVQRIENAVSQAAGVYQEDKNKGVSIRGARSDGTQYFVDGVKVIGTPTTPVAQVEQIQVITGGIPARYGDATGGVVNITTKGPSGEFHGSAEVQTSRGLDAFGYTQATVNLIGPIARNKKKDRTIAGFSLAGEYVNELDNNPSAVGVWQVKQSVLDQIKANPLIPNSQGRGFNTRSENLTFADLYKTSTRPNLTQNTYRGNASLSVSPIKNINMTVGGGLNYRRYYDLVKEYTLLNAENNPFRKEMNYRLFGRFQHNIGEGKKTANEEASTKSEKKSGIAIQNAYYSLQVDYEKFSQTYEDDNHGNNLFNYGYIGEFKTSRVRYFEPQVNYTDSVSGKTYQGFVQTNISDTAVAFRPGTLNPLGSRFTEQYYQLLGATKGEDGFYRLSGSGLKGFAQNIDQIAQNGALINGQRSQPVYNIWFNIGRQYNGFGVDRNDEQYRGQIYGSFDIVTLGSDKKNSHSIELGMEYEQRVQRSYAVNPLFLWDAATSYINSHLTLDRKNPTFIVGGQTYTVEQMRASNAPDFFVTDKIQFEYGVDPSLKQSYFDHNLRKALGLNPAGNDYIDLNALDVNKLSIDYFSADELLRFANQQVSNIVTNLRGYDHTGKVITQRTSLEGYFNDKNAEGYYTRLQGAFKPIYAAGYIQDRFFFKDLGIVAGLRVDAFNANQYVLKDPFSLYGIRTAGEVTKLVTSTGTRDVTHPENIGSDYAVYVNKLGADNSIVGYRKGEVWYDKYGNVSTGRLIAQETQGGAILPFVNLKDADKINYSNAIIQSVIQGGQKDIPFDPNGSFERYKTQYVIMPRLQFSFNITDKAQFFAHYDVLSQRPRGTRNQLNLAQYLYWDKFQTKNNPNLKPEITIDYEFGFKQVVSKNSAITISAYYKDFKNQVQLKKYFYAFPSDYTTYENIDFGSSKGVSLSYDFRRMANFQMGANYTLQFAEGTGSDDQSAQFLIGGNTPNLRTIIPLNYDARHTINLNLDYRFGQGKDYNGPTIKNSQILSNFGVNLVLIARSSVPFTTAPTVTPEGTISGGGRARTSSVDARLGWNFRGNLRINKDFTFQVGKKKEGKDRTELGLSVYLLIQNLWDAQYALTTYRFTSNPDDDGYLQSDNARVGIATQFNPNAYMDLYRAAVNDPDNYNTPRTIFLGAAFNF